MENKDTLNAPGQDASQAANNSSGAALNTAGVATTTTADELGSGTGTPAAEVEQKPEEIEGSAEQYENRIQDIEQRKAAFRIELTALVEKHLIAPDAHAVYSQHGTKVGVVLIDLKYNENIDERLPTFEEEQAMHKMMVSAMANK